MSSPCDRAEVVVKRAIDCGWLEEYSTDIPQLQATIRIALDTEVRAGGPWLDEPGRESMTDCPSCGGELSGLVTMIQHHEDWCTHRPPSGQGGQPDRSKGQPVDGYELDWISTRWRRMISSFNKAGRGKYIKQRLNRRARRHSNMERYDEQE